MKRILMALLVGGALFAAAWGAAATLTVADGTAATGSESIGSGCAVTGSTYALVGQDFTTDPTKLTGAPTDITKFTAVNIETEGCNFPLNVFIEVHTAGHTVLGSGSCEITDGDGSNESTDHGWGVDEDSAGDNVDGCTADTADADVAPAHHLHVTET